MRSLTFAVLLVLSAATFPQSVPPRFTMEWEALAAHLVGRLDLQPGERFIAVAHPGLFDELIPYLRYEVMKAGAVDLGVIDVLAEPVPAAWDEDVLREGGQAARDVLAEMLADVDASIMLPGANPAHPVYAAIQEVLRARRGRTIHFHWLHTRGASSGPCAAGKSASRVPSARIFASVLEIVPSTFRTVTPPPRVPRGVSFS